MASRGSPYTWVFAGGVLMAVAVLLGAFGAHGLKAHVTPDLLAVWETGVRYHVYHALALLILGPVQAFLGEAAERACRITGVLFIAGIVVFSGSLYVLTLTGVRWLGAVTPLGGVAFVVGWIVLSRGVWRARAG